MTAPPTLQLLDEFLRTNAWTPVDGPGLVRRYRPDPGLGIDDGYSLSMPANADAPDAGASLLRVVDTLAELHDISRDQLRIVLGVPDTVVSVRVENQATGFGAIPLPQFEGLVEKLRSALLDTASFVLTDAPLLEESAPEEAESYLARCQFLQTERGSFVAKVQLPAAVRLAEPSFFKKEAITSDDVNDKLRAVVDFAVNTVLPNNSDELLSEETLTSKIDVVSVNVLGDLVALFERTAAANLNIGFLSSRQRHLYQSGTLTDARLKRLEDFVSFARTQYASEFPIDFRGKIVELRSRNPKGNRNYVLLQGVHDGKAVYVALSLATSDYYHATQAHAQGRTIRIAGYARQMKTQLKLTTRELFQVLDN